MMPTQTELFVDAIFGLFLIWLIHLLPILVAGIPIWFFSRKRVRWNIWDFSIAIIPFWVWGVLMLTFNKGKGIGNFAESFIIACVILVSPIVRAVVLDRVNQTGLSAALLVFFSTIAIGLWAFIPATIE
jgi:hypothetical protein